MWTAILAVLKSAFDWLRSRNDTEAAVNKEKLDAQTETNKQIGEADKARDRARDAIRDDPGKLSDPTDPNAAKFDPNELN